MLASRQVSFNYSSPRVFCAWITMHRHATRIRTYESLSRYRINWKCYYKYSSPSLYLPFRHFSAMHNRSVRFPSVTFHRNLVREPRKASSKNTRRRYSRRRVAWNLIQSPCCAKLAHSRVIFIHTKCNQPTRLFVHFILLFFPYIISCY